MREVALPFISIAATTHALLDEISIGLGSNSLSLGIFETPVSTERGATYPENTESRLVASRENAQDNNGCLALLVATSAYAVKHCPREAGRNKADLSKREPMPSVDRYRKRWTTIRKSVMGASAQLDAAVMWIGEIDKAGSYESLEDS